VDGVSGETDDEFCYEDGASGETDGEFCHVDGASGETDGEFCHEDGASGETDGEFCYVDGASGETDGEFCHMEGVSGETYGTFCPVFIDICRVFVHIFPGAGDIPRPSGWLFHYSAGTVGTIAGAGGFCSSSRCLTSRPLSMRAFSI